jgi:hypothetical protein
VTIHKFVVTHVARIIVDRFDNYVTAIRWLFGKLGDGKVVKGAERWT